MCFLGPLGRVARPPRVGVVLVVARDLGAGREPRLADQHRHVRGGREQGFDRHGFGFDRPFLLQLARERERGVLVQVDRAAGPERPHARPARHPGRAPAGQPAALVVAHDAHHRQRAARVVGQPQRPAHLLELEREAVVGDVEARQPRREPVVRRRAAAGEVGDHPVGLGGRSPRWARSASRSSARTPAPAATDRAPGCRVERTRRLSLPAPRRRAAASVLSDVAPGPRRPSRVHWTHEH